MFPLFNYGLGFNSRFPDPKPIHKAREGSHTVAQDEPVMSGDDLAAAVVALAASCVIAYFAFRNGKGSKIIKSISGTSPTTPPASALSKLPPDGGGTGGGAVAAAISHESAAASSHSASHVSEEAVPVGTRSLERSAVEVTSDATSEAVAETEASRVPAADKTISGLDGRPPLPADALAEPPSSIPVGGSSGEPSPLAAELSDVVNKGLDPRAASAADSKGVANAASSAGVAASPNNAAKTSQPLTGGSTPTPPKSSSNPPPPPAQPAPPAHPVPPRSSAPPAPKVVEIKLPNGEKLVTKTNADGGQILSKYNFKGQLVEESRYEKGQLVAKSKFSYDEVDGCEITLEEKVKIVNGQEVAPVNPKPPSDNSGGTPPASSAPPASSTPSSSAPPAPPVATPAASSTRTASGAVLQNEIPELFLQRSLTAPDGKLTSAPILGAEGQTIGCSKLEYYPNGRIARNPIYGNDRKLQEWVEIAYTPEGQIEKFVFSDGTEKYAAAFDDDISKILGDDPKYSLLIKGFEKEVTIEAEQALSRGTKAFEAGDYESAVKSWRPLTKIRNVAIPDNLYEAEFQVGAAAYRKATELANAGEHIAAEEKRVEALEAWSALERIENKGCYHNYKGLCHEVMGNHEKAVEAFANGAEERDVQAMINLARHCETGQGLPNRNNLDLAVELYQKADATAEAERVAKTIEDIKVANEALANLEPLPAGDLAVSSQPPHPSQVLAKTFSLPLPATPAAAKSKSLPSELANATPDVLGKELFGAPRPMPFRTPAERLLTENAEIFAKGQSVYDDAGLLYKAAQEEAKKGQKQAVKAKYEAAREQFANAEIIWRPLLKHDTDGTYLNAVGQCLQGQGRHDEAKKYYFEAMLKEHEKAAYNLAVYCENGITLPNNQPDLKAAIDFFELAKAKEELERILQKTDLAKGFRVQAQAALDELNAASQPIVVTTLGHHTADAPAVLMN